MSRKRTLAIESVRHVYFNGKKITSFDVYETTYSTIYVGKKQIPGWFKREATILRKLNIPLSEYPPC